MLLQLGSTYICSVTIYNIVSKNKTVQRHFEVKGMCTFNLPTIESSDLSACESETTVDLNTGYNFFLPSIYIFVIVFTNTNLLF